MPHKNIMLTSYALCHFLVDFACAYLIFSKVYGQQDWYLCFLLYNFCAFALQMPLGLIADKWNHNAVLAALGCTLVASAYLFSGIPYVVVFLAGIGNGMFHIGGGTDVLNMTPTKSSALGIFVSPGALGIFLGTMFGKQALKFSLLTVLLLLLFAVMLLLLIYTHKHSLLSDNVPVSFQKLKHPVLIALSCLLLVVCLRSYVGMILGFPWKGQANYKYFLIFAVVLGKALGGILADRFGVIRLSAISLCLSALLFLFSSNPIAGILAVFFFNMTMPITLWAVAKLLPGSKGFSFGLLTFGLFLGFIPAYLELTPAFSTFTLALFSILSLALLMVGLKKVVNHGL